MRLDEVWISEFKNLQDLRIDFDEKSSYTVLVGENGSGKSNLIEALALIFRGLDRDEEAPFAYELRYRCRGHAVQVRAEARSHPRFWLKHAAGGKSRELPRKRFLTEDARGPLYRPAFVFGYYSGPNDRLAAIFEKHQERYYTWIIKSLAQRSGLTRPDDSLRRLFYARTLHGQFALLAFFMESVEGSERDRAFLREYLKIDGLDSVLFALRRPLWSRRGGDPRFWNAEGEVRQFLDRLYQSSLLPMRMPRRMTLGLTKNPAIENLYLFLPNQSALADVYALYGNQYAFFTALESTHLSGLLGEVRARVRMTPDVGGGEVTYRDLSEGEQQLLLVLGLLKFTARDETLFLLDEPDTHLNPAWSTQYLDYLDHFITHPDSCHILMSTHDPLVFAGLAREQVRIFRRGTQGRARVEVPDQDPRGMGVASILTSDLFRLRSTLDPETQKDLDDQRILSMKDHLTPEEEVTLRNARERLRGKGFEQNVRDPLYALFLKAWSEREDPAWLNAVQLTPEQREARARLAREILVEIRRGSQDS